MKITRDMAHPDLQPAFNQMKLFPLLVKPRWMTKLLNRALNLGKGKDIDGLRCDEKHIPSNHDDYAIRIRIYRPLDQEGELPILLYIHGGGYITGSPEMSADAIEGFIKARPCIVVAPDYRKSYTRPFPAGLNDCYDTLLWAQANAAQLNGRADKLVVAGHSAGGGLTAAVTLKARDTGDVNIAFQMPIYPMIDDLQPSDPERDISAPVWDTDINRVAWKAYLADLHKDGAGIPAYAAPARNLDYRGFPPTITFVGDMEPFYRETLNYVDALRRENVEVAFKEYAGCFHGFDMLAPESDIGKDALAFTYDTFAEFLDRYLG